MASRSERQKQKMESAFLANAKAIFDFCLDQQMPFVDADWCSRQSLEFDSFLWFYDKAKGKPQNLRRMISARLRKIEANRQVSMFERAENLEVEEEDG